MDNRARTLSTPPSPPSPIRPGERSLARLTVGDASVAELAAPFSMSQAAISKHLKVLERARLITRGRDAQRRPRRLAAAPLADATAWLDGYRTFWEGSFQRLDTVLEEIKAQRSGDVVDGGTLE